MSNAYDDFMDSWRNRLTALGVILDLKPLPEDVTLRVPAAEINQGCAGGFTDPRRVEGTCRESISADKSVEYPAQQHHGTTIIELGDSVIRAEERAKQDAQEAMDRETMRKDFKWSIYKQCDREDEAEERAKLFRETTRALLPEFAHLIKRDGDHNHVPHDCVDNLNCDLFCNICGASYEKACKRREIHLVAKGER